MLKSIWVIAALLIFAAIGAPNAHADSYNVKFSVLSSGGNPHPSPIFGPATVSGTGALTFSVTPFPGAPPTSVTLQLCPKNVTDPLICVTDQLYYCDECLLSFPTNTNPQPEVDSFSENYFALYDAVNGNESSAAVPLSADGTGVPLPFSFGTITLVPIPVNQPAQTQPTAITVSPANPLIAVGTGQLFTALSTTPLVFGEASSLSLGQEHTCALLGNGTVECWGANGSGQLGNGTTIDSNVPVPVAGLTGVIGITTGGAHSCALLDYGGVECWGANGFGQLGDGTTNNSSVPVPVKAAKTFTFLNGVIQVAAGYESTCALAFDGTVQCWGNNAHGELGNNLANSYVPISVVGADGNALGSVVAIAAGTGQGGLGGGHACALLGNSTVECWGDNTYGQLGNHVSSFSQAVVVKNLDGNSLTGVTAIAAGDAHSCALVYDGTVQCWGWNSFGQLGNGSTTDSSTGNFAPVAVIGLSGNVTGIAAGYGQSCALMDNGIEECWGDNSFGELGNGNTTSSATPVGVSALNAAIARVYAGGFHTCALLSDGSVECWGHNSDGELGDGTMSGSNVPTTVIGGDNLPGRGVTHLASIGSTSYDACAGMSDGTARCWGGIDYGQLGNGTGGSSSIPVTVSGLNGVTAISTGQENACGLLAYGTVGCWGGNMYGELGNGTWNGSTTPGGVANLGGVKAISAGSYFDCALLSSGTVDCWGYNALSELGNGTTTSASPYSISAPVPVVGLAGVKAISSGGDHTCALIAGDGSVQCWGDNSVGELGNGTTNSVPPYSDSTPVSVNGLVGAKAISSGAVHTCAVLVDGELRCWGSNFAGQLGNGTMTNSNVPVAVNLPNGRVTGVATGYGHSCALFPTGRVQCWGLNDNGQLGDGTTTSSITAVNVTGLSAPAVAITASLFDTCALLADGTTVCWGGNAQGEFGNGTTTSSSTPVPSNPLVPSASWISGTPGVGTINPVSGQALGVSNGMTTITATYGNLSANAVLTVGTAPAITSADNTTFTVGSLGSFTVTASGYPPPAFSESGTLPSGVTFNTTTGLLSGTPAAGGTYNLTFTASNGISPSAVQNFALTVNVNGNLTISIGQTYTFVNGKVGGNLVMNGGTLVLNNTVVGGNLQMNGGSLMLTNNSTVKGNLQVTGSSTFSIGPGQITGNLQIQNIPVGSAQNQICGTTVKGNLQFQNNGTAVLIGGPPSCLGNTVSGNLQVTGNTAATQVDNNAVSGNLQVTNNSAATQVDNDTVSGNLQVQNNTASTAVSFNVVKSNLQCTGNNSALITGGGNTAKQKQGQCASF